MRAIVPACSVSGAGDVNGDGVDDLIIGASRAGPNGDSDAGQSYVVFGGAGVGSSGVLELSALDGSNGFALNGINADDWSGFSVSGAGDVNGDGVDDIIIGALAADPNGDRPGQSYVVFGRASDSASRPSPPCAPSATPTATAPPRSPSSSGATARPSPRSRTPPTAA